MNFCNGGKEKANINTLSNHYQTSQHCHPQPFMSETSQLNGSPGKVVKNFLPPEGLNVRISKVLNLKVLNEVNLKLPISCH